MQRLQMIKRLLRGMLFLACLGYVACVGAQGSSGWEQSRGELLYSTHCIACHTSQVHWREQRLATDWQSLTKQVRRWQINTRLRWNEEDVAAVAEYLNSLYYHFPAEKSGKATSLREQERTFPHK